MKRRKRRKKSSRKVVYRTRRPNRKRSKRFLQKAIKRPGALTSTLRKWKILGKRKQVGDLKATQLARAYAKAKKMSQTSSGGKKKLGSRTMRQINLYRLVLKPASKRKSMKALKTRIGGRPSKRKAANGSPFKTGYYQPDDQLAHEIKVKMKMGKSEGRAIAEVASLYDLSDAQLERVLNLLKKKGGSRRRKNPDVKLHWTQRGHTVYDPTGHRLHEMKAWWRTGLKKPKAVREAVKKAHKYALKQKDWVKHRVTVEGNPRMKASDKFVRTLDTGLSRVISQVGKEKALAHFKAHPFGLYHMVYEDVTPGHEHNAHLGLPKNTAFKEESRSLTDDQIETAVKHVINKRAAHSANPRSNWGKTEFSVGPLKSEAAVKRLAAKLKAKRAPYAQDAGRYADRYWDSILAQPEEQRKLLDIDRRYSNPRSKNPIYHYKHRYDSKQPWQRSEVFAEDYDFATQLMLKRHPDMQIDLDGIQDIDSRSYARLGLSPTWEGLGPYRKHHRKVWRPSRKTLLRPRARN